MPSNSKSVLVTGATGFIGSHLTRRLVGEGYEVHIFVRESSDTRRIKDVVSKVKVHSVDLRDAKQIKSALDLIKPEYIFHLAIGGVYGSQSFSDRDMFEANLIGTVNLIEAANGVPYKLFVNTGSSGEYGQKQEPMKETDTCEPANVYGISKYAATLYASLIAKTKSKPIITLRPFSPFGSGEADTRLTAYAAGKLVKNEELLLGNPDSARDFIYVEDLVDAYFKCIENPPSAGEVINVGSGREATVRDVVEKMKELAGSTSEIKWNTGVSRPGESGKWQANIEKAKKLLNWEPRHTLEEGLAETIAWYKSNE